MFISSAVRTLNLREKCVYIILVFSIVGKYFHNYIVSVKMYARCAGLQFNL